MSAARQNKLFGVVGSQEGSRRAVLSPLASQGALRVISGRSFPAPITQKAGLWGQGERRGALSHHEFLACAAGEQAALSLELCSEPLSQRTCVSAEPGSADQCAHTHARTHTGSFYPNTITAPPSPGEPAALPGPPVAPLHCRGDPSPLRGPGLGSRWSYTPLTAHGTGSGPT